MQKLTLGERAADQVSRIVGSWEFIIVQGLALTAWVWINSLHVSWRWDGPPFILLNLILSFQAAFTAPAIMIAQNRQARMDRLQATHIESVVVRMESMEARLLEMLSQRCSGQKK